MLTLTVHKSKSLSDFFLSFFRRLLQVLTTCSILEKWRHKSKDFLSVKYLGKSLLGFPLHWASQNLKFLNVAAGKRTFQKTCCRCNRKGRMKKCDNGPVFDAPYSENEPSKLKVFPALANTPKFSGNLNVKKTKNDEFGVKLPPQWTSKTKIVTHKPNFTKA